jgi:hypothetical protein
LVLLVKQGAAAGTGAPLQLARLLLLLLLLLLGRFV